MGPWSSNGVLISVRPLVRPSEFVLFALYRTNLGSDGIYRPKLVPTLYCCGAATYDIDCILDPSQFSQIRIE